MGALRGEAGVVSGSQGHHLNVMLEVASTTGTEGVSFTLEEGVPLWTEV
jgi:hypothetical protein